MRILVTLVKGLLGGATLLGVTTMPEDFAAFLRRVADMIAGGEHIVLWVIGAALILWAAFDVFKWWREKPVRSGKQSRTAPTVGDGEAWSRLSLIWNLILGKRFRYKRDARVPFRRDQGRGDLAACLIETAPDFQKAEAIFNDWRHDREPRAMELAVGAMVARIRDEGETPQTETFLNKEFSQFPEDPHGVNDQHQFEWRVMCFEGMWKQPHLFPRKDEND